MALPLRICQFNVLAPSARICPPLDTVPWRHRHSAICDLLIKLEPDIVCLQEFDFAPRTDGFAGLYEERLGGIFSLHLKQRTGRKHEGLALLLRKGVFRDVQVQKLELEPSFCDRVALVARMHHLATGMPITLANTHLTVAHAHNNHDIPMCRPLQMQQVLDAVPTSMAEDVVIVCADMNCDHLETEDPVLPGRRLPSGYSAADVSRPVHMAFERGFASALHAAIPGVRLVSHTCSYAQDGCVDYVFFRQHPHLKLARAFLHPAELPPDTAWRADVGWGSEAEATLSDHRPLVCDFRLCPQLGG